jgi:hypothetical protein
VPQFYDNFGASVEVRKAASLFTALGIGGTA